MNSRREALVAMDFFSVPPPVFRLLDVLVVIEHGRRKVLHATVTAHPTAAWVSPQMRAAFPLGVAPRFLLMDRDSILSAEVCRVLQHMGVRPMRTSFQSPWQNGVVERWAGTGRRALLDHVIMPGENHLRRLLREFLDYSPNDRTHLSLGTDPPAPRAACPPPSPIATVAALPPIGGVHHRYEWQEAA